MGLELETWDYSWNLDLNLGFENSNFIFKKQKK